MIVAAFTTRNAQRRSVSHCRQAIDYTGISGRRAPVRVGRGVVAQRLCRNRGWGRGWASGLSRG